jgi:hypothetical protein
LIAALPSETLPIVTNPKSRLAGFAIRDQFDFRNRTERLKEFPQCVFCHIRGKISHIKLHVDW